jgi:16S rRNA (guanine966-N2)-methyltransferase
MRIIAGRFKGRQIPLAPSANYRPSTGKLKEAVFSILSAYLDFSEANVLDLCSGTGAFGFEAASRGAKRITLVDIELKYLDRAQEFAQKLGILDQMSCVKANATLLPNLAQKYDLVFLDPPYYQGIAKSALIELDKKKLLSDQALLVIELGKREEIVIPECYEIFDSRIYGSAKVILVTYRNKVQ